MRTMLDLMNKSYHKGNLTIEQIQKWFDPIDLKSTKIKKHVFFTIPTTVPKDAPRFTKGFHDFH